MSNEEQQIKQLAELNVEMRIMKQNFASITKKLKNWLKMMNQLLKHI